MWRALFPRTPACPLAAALAERGDTVSDSVSKQEQPLTTSAPDHAAVAKRWPIKAASEAAP